MTGSTGADLVCSTVALVECSTQNHRSWIEGHEPVDGVGSEQVSSTVGRWNAAPDTQDDEDRNCKNCTNRWAPDMRQTRLVVFLFVKMKGKTIVLNSQARISTFLV